MNHTNIKVIKKNINYKKMNTRNLNKNMINYWNKTRIKNCKFINNINKKYNNKSGKLII